MKHFLYDEIMTYNFASEMAAEIKCNNLPLRFSTREQVCQIFLGKIYQKTGGNVPNEHKITEWK
jgi:hypothetical protein